MEKKEEEEEQKLPFSPSLPPSPPPALVGDVADGKKKRKGKKLLQWISRGNEYVGFFSNFNLFFF